jgi:hypothetical protein
MPAPFLRQAYVCAAVVYFGFCLGMPKYSQRLEWVLSPEIYR